MARAIHFKELKSKRRNTALRWLRVNPLSPIAYGLTESGAASDAAAMTTKAVKHGDKYVINGSKCFISNGPIADVLSLFAMTDSSKGVKGISAFIVEKTFPGYGVAKWESKMGIKGSPTGELVFQDMEVPAKTSLGMRTRVSCML